MLRITHFFFFFNDTATTEIYTLSLHDALPIYYATANAFMDQFAGYRNRQVTAGERHGHTRSINWPLWQAGGMAIDAAGRSGEANPGLPCPSHTPCPPLAVKKTHPHAYTHQPLS